MMERRVFTSEEVYSYEGSLEEPVDLYDHESQMRFRQNVVYIPHMLPPVLILEYVPYYYNYQTYEPYLINRYEVVYIPFVRQVSYIQFVPYYSLQAPEAISSSIQYDDAILPNRSPSPDSSNTFETAASEFSFSSEDNDSEHTESPPEVILESTIYRERSVEQAFIDDLEYEHDVNSSTRDVGEMSILSLSSSESSNLTPELITTENCEISKSQGLLYPEVSSYDNGAVTDWKHAENICSADDAGRDIGADSIKLSCFDVTKKSDLVNEIEEQAFRDNCISKKEDIPHNDSEHDVALHYFEGISSTDDACRAKEADSIKLSCFDVKKKSDLVNEIEEQAFRDNCISKKEDIPHNDSEHDVALHYPEGISSTDDTGRDMEADSIKLSCFDVTKKSDLVNEIEEQAFRDNCISKKEDIPHNDSEHDVALHYPEGISSTDDASRAKEADFPNSSSFDVTEKFEVVNPVDEDQQDEDSSFYTDDEDDGPPIRSILENVIPSFEHWRAQREEYCIRRNNHELYRSALEGDIRPRKSLPDVGTLATIFEDLPYPVNEPYDDGQDSNVDEFFDLPPLEVKKSESSSSALIPKKKKFRNTRKLFSRLFRCFKPKTVISVKPP